MRPEALEAVSDLSELGPDIVGLLADNSRVSEARAAGFKGLVRRDVSGSSLQAALVAVSAGMIVVDSEFDQARPGLGQGPPLPQREPLTPREIEVLELVAQGLPDKAVAHRLGISDHTVKFHVNSVLTKLSAQSRTEAVVNATRQGIILL
jgi:two-component system nitrate/nitrite response regulator NarL